MVQADEKLRVVGYGPSSVYLSLAPLFHIAGLNSTLAVTLGGGAHVFLERGGDVAAALDAIDCHRVDTLVRGGVCVCVCVCVCMRSRS
jgi:acyl-CoA synthetase (AMP-forming)/AMP-acid ligase II